jgi:lipoyl synthase
MPSSPETVWNANEKQLLSLLNSGALMGKKGCVRFYAPSFTYYKTRNFCSSNTQFPTVSVTGTSCALNCKHCGGKVLGTMQPAKTPQQLFNLAAELKAKGAVGCLISGGCSPDGSVPLSQFAEVIGRIKRELGLTVFVHTGIIDLASAVLLKKAGVDATLIDVIGSDETVKKVYNLSVSVKNYADSLNALQQAGLTFVPHVIAGLNDGKLDGEFEALKMIMPLKPSAIVIIAFMPIRGTEMEKAESPKPLDIAKVAAAARLMFPKTPLVLGCMRPKGRLRAETDVYALKAGVDAIAFPSEKAVDYAKAQGWKVSFSPYCCAQIYMDFPNRSISK